MNVSFLKDELVNFKIVECEPNCLEPPMSVASVKNSLVELIVPLLLSFSFLPLYAPEALAVVGLIDSENRFPFVVQLSASNDVQSWSCSAIASNNGFLVATAAHCLWEPTGGWAKTVEIKFKDVDGVPRVARAAKMFIPKEFPDLYTRYKALDFITDKTSAGLYKDFTEKDAAIIVPDGLVQTGGFANWAFEYLSQPYLTAEDGSYGVADVIQRVVARELGPPEKLRAVRVGYGQFFCADYSINNKHDGLGCRSDANRRYTEVDVAPKISNFGVAVQAPWSWCTGRNKDNINPVRPGDSGGPILVRAMDGRWMFLGFTSNGGEDFGCASSLFSNIRLYHEAYESPEHMELIRKHVEQRLPWKGSSNIYQKQAERLFRDLLENWSLSNEVALKYLKSAYAYTGLALNGIDQKYDWFFSEKVRFAEKWPVRSYRLDPAGQFQTDCPFRDFSECVVSAAVRWRVENPETKEVRVGVSKLTLKIEASNLVIVNLNGRIPPIKGEQWSTLSGSPIHDFSPSYQRKFRIYNSVDFDATGGEPDLATLDGATDVQSCQRECNKNFYCHAFTFSKTSKKCFLKGDVGLPLDEPNSISGWDTESGLDEPIIRKLGRMQITPNTDYDGADFWNKRNISVQQCSALCLANTKCAAFSYVERLQWCWLKVVAGSGVQKSGITGGAREILVDNVSKEARDRICKSANWCPPGCC